MAKPLQPIPHAYLDYALGILLIASPYLFGFHAVSAAASNVFTGTGILILAVSLLTDYSLGLIHLLPFKVHGVIETLGAIGLLVSPWALGFAGDVSIATNLAAIYAVVYLAIIALTNYSGVASRPIHR